ncbi:MAG: methyltransferase [Planctomyces sp.]|nr:methyltransferase [Planctomyces sp.]
MAKKQVRRLKRSTSQSSSGGRSGQRMSDGQAPQNLSGAPSSQNPRSSQNGQEADGGIRLKSTADRLLLNEAKEIQGNDILAILLYGTTLASGLKESLPDRRFTFYTPEYFFLETLQEFHQECTCPDESSDSQPIVVWTTPDSENDPSIRIMCAPDLPDRQYDAVVFTTNPVSSSEQTQEYLQAAHQRLKDGGQMIASTSNPNDKWLHEQMRELYSRVTVRKDSRGVVYLATRTQPLKKIRDFHASSAFRMGEVLLHVKTRPGVFSHRKVDGGARALIRSLQPYPEVGESSQVRPENRAPAKIVDLGCGSGAVAMAAAIKYPSASVLAIDSHARAIECTLQNAQLNGITTVDVMLAADAEIPEPNSWDLVLTNPPYYSDYRISELFLNAALRALRPGGEVRLVTKLTDWHIPRMEQSFRNVTAREIGEYTVISGWKR